MALEKPDRVDTTPRRPRPTREQVNNLEADIICYKREKAQLEDNNATLRETRRQIEDAQKGLTGIRRRAAELAYELQQNLVHERTVLLGMELDEDRPEPDPDRVSDLAERMVLARNPLDSGSALIPLGKIIMTSLLRSKHPKAISWVNVAWAY